MKLIESIAVQDFNSAEDDVIVRLKNGRIVQISPDFNCVNLWPNQQAFDDWNLDKAHIVYTDMGGNAAGELEAENDVLCADEMGDD
jgi:hypothetical protein